MKKVWLVCLAFLGMSMLGGCKLTDSQAKVVAQNAGLAASVTWMAYDDPSVEERQLVKEVMEIVKGVTADTSNGQTYTEVLYPLIEAHVDKSVAEGKIKPNERPLVLAGSLALLNGIDLLFATNPDWGDNHKLAKEVVVSFIRGAESGLGLAEDDQRLVNARNARTVRKRVFNQ